MTKHYSELEPNKWNLKHMTDYMVDKHREVFGVEYRPYGSWQIDRNMISQVFGTGRKNGPYPKELFVRFIDEGFASYKPTEKYPGTNFTFLVKWRPEVFQRVEKEYNERLKDAEAVEPEVDEIEDWFNS